MDLFGSEFNANTILDISSVSNLSILNLVKTRGIIRVKVSDEFKNTLTKLGLYDSDIIYFGKRIEDDYVDSILDLLDKNLKLKSEQEGLLMGDTYMDKINVLLELLEDVGKEHLVVEFMDKIHDTNPHLIMKKEDS